MAEKLENQEMAMESESDGIVEMPTEPDALEVPEGIDELTRERDELKDLLLRKQAEFENFRKRTERERSDFVQYATAEVMREMLNVLDSF